MIDTVGQNVRAKKIVALVWSVAMTSALMVAAVGGLNPPAEAITATGTVNVGEYPTAIVVNELTNRVYVANTGSDTISELNGDSLARRDIKVGSWPRALALYKPGNLVFVANYLSNSISVVTPSATPSISDIAVPDGPVDIAVNETTKKAYVASVVSSAVTVIDIPTLTVEATLPFPFAGVWKIVVNKTTNKVIAGTQDGHIIVIDGATLAIDAALFAGGQWVYDLALDESTNMLFSANNVLAPNPALPDTISVTDLNTFTQAYIDLDPSVNKVYLLRAVDVDPVTHKAYVVGYMNVNLVEVDVSAFPSVTYNLIPIGVTHTEATIHPGARRLYMPNATPETVDQMSLVDYSFSRTWVGRDPMAQALDIPRNRLYVANSGSNNVTAVVGDCGPGMPGSTKTAYLGEGSTTNFQEWVVLANPAATQTQACLSYFTSAGFAGGRWITIGPNRRVSIRVNDTVVADEVSTRIDSGPNPVSAERAMYSQATGLYGAHLGKESATPSNNWLLPEGVSAGGSETWVLVANPSTSITATATVRFLTANGPVGLPPVTLPPLTRRSFRVGAYVSSFEVSTEVTSTGAGVIAERATYLGHSGYVGSTESPGITAPSSTWYVGEGATAGGFDTWILLANPSATTNATANLTFLTSTGPITGPTVSIPPKSRRTVRVNDYVTDFDVATKVSSSIPIAVERAIYANHPVHGKGSATGEAMAALKTSWLLVEGATAGGFETWTLVANPTATTQTVRIRYLTNSGMVAPAALQSISLAPGQRKSFRANDFVPNNYTVSARVELVGAGPGVIAEHTIFAPASLAQDMTSGPGL